MLSSISTFDELTLSVSTFDPSTSYHFTAIPRGRWVEPSVLEGLASHTADKWPSLPFVFAIEHYVEQRNGPEFHPHLHFIVECSPAEAAEVCSYLRTFRQSPRLHQSGSVHFRPIEGASHLHRLPGYWSKDIAPIFYSSSLSAHMEEPDEWTSTDTSEPLPF